jgi:hypothetical protein
MGAKKFPKFPKLDAGQERELAWTAAGGPVQQLPVIMTEYTRTGLPPTA